MIVVVACEVGHGIISIVVRESQRILLVRFSGNRVCGGLAVVSSSEQNTRPGVDGTSVLLCS